MSRVKDDGANEQLVLRWIEAINERRFDFFDDLFSAEYVNHNPPPGGQAHGVEGLKDFFRELCDGLDGFKYTVDELLSNDNRVTVRLTGRGKHIGEVMGRPPTGGLAEVSVTHVFEISDGRISARWGDPANPPILRATDG